MDAEKVMQEILEVAPLSEITRRLPYIEEHAPHRLPICYDVMRTFLGITMQRTNQSLEILESRHLVEILSGEGIIDISTNLGVPEGRGSIYTVY